METSALGVEDLRLAGNLPELTLEGAERLLPRAIDELLLAIPRLRFVRSVRLQPGGDLSAQFARERGVVVEGVLETSCKVHLRGANFWESVEEALWERGSAMLNHTRKAARSRERAEPFKHAKVQRNLRNATAREWDPTVARPRLNGYLAQPPCTRTQSRKFHIKAVQICGQLFLGGVVRPNLTDLSTNADLYSRRLN